MMFDIAAWIYFAFRLFMYSIVLFLIAIGLISAFALGYYWLVIRPRRVQNQVEIKTTFANRSFTFHTLTLQITTHGTILLNVQLSQLEKEPIEVGLLNEQRYQITGFDVQDEQMTITFVNANIQLIIKHENIDQRSSHTQRSYFVHEYTFIWSSSEYRTRFIDQFNLNDTGYWYGGSTQRTVYWPINQSVTKHQAMIPNDAYKNVCERYWLSSLGLALFVDPLVPLFVSMNGRHLQFISEYRTPYQQRTFVSHQFQYRLLQHVNMRDLHITMINRYLGKPTAVPNQRMITEPIWSTRTQLKQNINSENLLNYAQEIVQRNFPRSQICIDGDWTSYQGILEFDQKKFPQPKQLIQKLKELDFRVTLAVHPLISCRSARFFQYWRRGLLINTSILSNLSDLIIEQSRFLQSIFDDIYSNPQFQPFLTVLKSLYQGFFYSFPGLSFWRNDLVGVLDLTNPSARDEYSSNLQRLQKLYEIDSFKFDASEVSRLPIFSTFSNPSCEQMTVDKTTMVTTPALYSYLYAQLAHGIDTTDRLQEVQVGYRTQTLPVFVRIVNKDSNWTYANGLRSLLPSIFNISLLGYPFIVPDMVGGNGGGQADLPQRELYIRWLQLNILLPAVQFSFPPWLYQDEQVVQIARKCLQIRENYRAVLLNTAQECIEYGTPMIRPLWFSDPYDIKAQLCDNQYMLGHDLLIAPVLEENISELNIYFPEGQWQCIHTKHIYDGQQAHIYPVTIEDIPIFERC